MAGRADRVTRRRNRSGGVTWRCRRLVSCRFGRSAGPATSASRVFIGAAGNFAGGWDDHRLRERIRRAWKINSGDGWFVRVPKYKSMRPFCGFFNELLVGDL